MKLISNSKIIFYSNWVVKNHRTIKFSSFSPSIDYTTLLYSQTEGFWMFTNLNWDSLFCMNKYSHRKNVLLFNRFSSFGLCSFLKNHSRILLRRTCKSSWIFNKHFHLLFPFFFLYCFWSAILNFHINDSVLLNMPSRLHSSILSSSSSLLCM